MNCKLVTDFQNLRSPSPSCISFTTAWRLMLQYFVRELFPRGQFHVLSCIIHHITFKRRHRWKRPQQSSSARWKRNSQLIIGKHSTFVGSWVLVSNREVFWSCYRMNFTCYLHNFIFHWIWVCRRRRILIIKKKKNYEIFTDFWIHIWLLNFS